jgi:Zn finger protein HypA/HybF involved in hydrogenase expression
MHELEVTKSILASIRSAAQREGIVPTSARILIGELTTFKPDPIRYYAGVLCENDAFLKSVVLEVEMVAGVLECSSCGAIGASASDLALACASCASREVTVVSGDEVIVKSVRGS